VIVAGPATKKTKPHPLEHLPIAPPADRAVYSTKLESAAPRRHRVCQNRAPLPVLRNRKPRNRNKRNLKKKDQTQKTSSRHIRSFFYMWTGSPGIGDASLCGLRNPLASKAHILKKLILTRSKPKQPLALNKPTSHYSTLPERQGGETRLAPRNVAAVRANKTTTNKQKNHAWQKSSESHINDDGGSHHAFHVAGRRYRKQIGLARGLNKTSKKKKHKVHNFRGEEHTTEPHPEPHPTPGYKYHFPGRAAGR